MQKNGQYLLQGVWGWKLKKHTRIAHASVGYSMTTVPKSKVAQSVSEPVGQWQCHLLQLEMVMCALGGLSIRDFPFPNIHLMVMMMRLRIFPK